MHNSLLLGHLGCKKTKEKILQRFYWYALKEDVRLYIQKCDTCAADKKPNKVPRVPLGNLPAGAPGDCVATDYLGPLALTDRGYCYILLLTDHFTKYVEILPVPDMTAEVCVSKILNEFISRWGCPYTATKVGHMKVRSSDNYAECWKSEKPEPAPETRVAMDSLSVSIGHYCAWLKLICAENNQTGIFTLGALMEHTVQRQTSLPSLLLIY